MAEHLADNDWRTVWVTGASSGMGLEVCRLLDREGVNVAASARSADKLNEIARKSDHIAAYPLDVTDQDAVATSIEQIEDKTGNIDLAILNAGVWELMDSIDLDARAVRAGIETNYMGVINALDALLPRMLERKRGHIAIVASVAGYRGLPRSIAYGPTKAALINLAEILKSELEPHGIIVSVINPGFIDTPLTRDNPFPMPMLMQADVAAACMLAGLKRKKYEIIFPRRFVLAMKLLRVVPNIVFFWVVGRFMVKTRK